MHFVLQLRSFFEYHFKYNFLHYFIILLQFKTIFAFKIEAIERSMFNLSDKFRYRKMNQMLRNIQSLKAPLPEFTKKILIKG